MSAALTASSPSTEASKTRISPPISSFIPSLPLSFSLLIGCFRGEGEKTQVTIRGGGPIGTVQCIAEATGRVKGLVGDASVDPPLRADGKLDVGAAVGRAGVCAVVRSPPFTDKGWEQPYTGMVALESGEIAEDLAAYLAESEQVQCALALGVSVGRDGAVDGAGGYLVQVLPFADDETLAALEANIAAAGPVTAMLAEGLGPREVTARLLEGLGAGDEGFSLEPSYGPCDAEELRERMRRAIATLGEGEARAILEEQGRVEMTCEFCRVTHALDEAEVMAAVAAAQA